MKIVANKIIWSKLGGKYVALKNEDDTWYAAWLDGEGPPPTPTLGPLNVNEYGYSCWRCQGFIRYDQMHSCPGEEGVRWTNNNDKLNGSTGFTVETADIGRKAKLTSFILGAAVSVVQQILKVALALKIIERRQNEKCN